MQEHVQHVLSRAFAILTHVLLFKESSPRTPACRPIARFPIVFPIARYSNVARQRIEVARICARIEDILVVTTLQMMIN
jgi:hypothetical protein